MTNLLPCPFCGSDARIYEYKTPLGMKFKYDGVYGEINCSKDGCCLYTNNSFGWVGDEDKLDMIKAWNTRVKTEEE